MIMLCIRALGVFFLQELVVASTHKRRHHIRVCKAEKRRNIDQPAISKRSQYYQSKNKKPTKIVLKLWTTVSAISRVEQTPA